MGMGSLGGRAPVTPGLNQQAAFGGQGGNDVREMILDAIKKTTYGDEGTTREAVFQRLQSTGKNITMAEVSKHVQQMHDDGAVYGTVDESHFMSTE